MLLFVFNIKGEMEFVQVFSSCFPLNQNATAVKDVDTNLKVMTMEEKSKALPEKQSFVFKPQQR